MSGGIAGSLSLLLTFAGGGLVVSLTALFARKKQRADTANVQATTESIQVTADNAIATTGLTVLQAVMLALQQENTGLVAERADLKAQVVDLVGRLRSVDEQAGEPYRVQLEHQAGTLARLRAEIIEVRQENVRLQSALEERAAAAPGQAAAGAGTGTSSIGRATS